MRSDVFAAGLRVLMRHLRYAKSDPRKVYWIVRRILEIARTGKLHAVLARHRAVAVSEGEYRTWMMEEAALSASRRAHLLRDMADWISAPKFSVIVPVYEPCREYLEFALASVARQSYVNWELCIVDDGSVDRAHVAALEELAEADMRVKFGCRDQNGGIAIATNDALALATGDFVVFLDQDDVLAQDALLEFAAIVRQLPNVTLMFADEDRINDSGERSNPFFKPSFDVEWLRTTNCVMHPVAVRRDVLQDIGGLATGVDGAQDWELLLRLSEVIPGHHIVHCARVLYHWREHPGSTAAAIYEKPSVVGAQLRVMQWFHARRGEIVTIERGLSGWRIKRNLPQPTPLVSVIVPTRDRVELMRRCVKGLRERTRYAPWECIIVDNGSTDPGAVALLAEIARDPAFKVVRDNGDFNYARLCNVGAEASAGEILVFLNNDVEPMNDEWLCELVVNVARPDIGMVGAMLYYPDRTIQHAGVVLWVNGVADRPYLGLPRGFPGVDHRLAAVHSVDTMITACAAVRRGLYTEVGGMDEGLPVACNDLDLCLKVAERGFRNVITPYAELYHRESASRGYHYRTPEAMQEARDEARFREKWASRHPTDRMYNANLALAGAAFSIGHPLP